ncbi:MAG: hypothetical protein WCP19_10225, partial [Chloroflexota bacterium]
MALNVFFTQYLLIFPVTAMIYINMNVDQFQSEEFGEKQPAAAEAESGIDNPRAGVWRRAAAYMVSKAVQIAITIFAGIFLTVLLASKSGQMENIARTQVDRYVMLLNNAQFYAPNQTEDEYTAALRTSLEHEAGLDLSFWPRQLKWTINALKLDWGRAVSTNMMPVFSLVKTNLSLKEVLLRYLPNTILLAGSSIFLVFIFGIPLAMFLSRNYGSSLDRFFSLLVPISSVPSWVHAVLLISIFAVQFHILP